MKERASCLTISLYDRSDVDVRSLDLIMRPGLVILDLPLVTFRDSDETDEILKDSRTKIWCGMLSTGIWRTPKDCQIIILENEDPPTDLVESISSHHFTGSSSLGRKGFFLQDHQPNPRNVS